MHRALRRTRGAVAGVALVTPATRSIAFAGIGNTDVRVAGPGMARLFSRPGLLGGTQPVRPSLQTAPLPPGTLVILTTDGVQL